MESAELEEETFALPDRFPLAEKIRQRVATLPRGQRDKLALTCYEGSKETHWFFDEPFASGMDAGGLCEMKKLLRHAVAGQRSAISTTQLVGYALFGPLKTLSESGKMGPFSRPTRSEPFLGEPRTITQKSHDALFSCKSYEELAKALIVAIKDLEHEPDCPTPLYVVLGRKGLF